MEDLREMLQKMETALNNMDVEANLMSEEERNAVSIHTTCRQHFNDIRRRFKEAEELTESLRKVSNDNLNGQGINQDPEMGNFGDIDRTNGLTHKGSSDNNKIIGNFESAQDDNTTRESLMNGNFND